MLLQCSKISVFFVLMGNKTVGLVLARLWFLRNFEQLKVQPSPMNSDPNSSAYKQNPNA